MSSDSMRGTNENSQNVLPQRLSIFKNQALRLKHTTFYLFVAQRFTSKKRTTIFVCYLAIHFQETYNDAEFAGLQCKSA